MANKLKIARLNWLTRFIIALIASYLFSITLPPDALSSPAHNLVNAALFISLICFLLLPAVTSLNTLLVNSFSSIAVLTILFQLPVAIAISLNILIQVCIVIFCLSTVLWSLTQLFEQISPRKDNIRSTVFLWAAILTGSPIWAGPLVDIFQPGNTLINFIISITPLTHFSVAADYDYLRSEWLYQNTPFGSLPFVYPNFTSIVIYYLLFAASLQIILWRVTRHIQPLNLYKTV